MYQPTNSQTKVGKPTIELDLKNLDLNILASLEGTALGVILQEFDLEDGTLSLRAKNHGSHSSHDSHSSHHSHSASMPL
jgi:hypothetical protein